MAKKSDSGVTRQPSTTPVYERGNNASVPSVDVSAYNSLFVGMVLNMSWQLAVVVIVPIVGGYMLDQRLHSSPWLVLTGLAVAVLATCGVLWRTVKLANSRVAALQSKGDKK